MLDASAPGAAEEDTRYPIQADIQGRRDDNDKMPLIADARQIQNIDVVAVALNRSPDWNRWTAVPGEVVGTWSGENVRVALALIASLPEAEQMRCFTPSYGIRLRAGTSVLAEVAFCFRCHNALGLPSAHTPNLPNWFTFDPDSTPAQQLLRLFRECGRPAS